MRTFSFYFFLALFSAASCAQSLSDSVEFVQKKFEQFQYADVIKISDRLLSKKDSLSKSELISIYKVKAVSHFALAEDEEASESFIELLKVDSTHMLDSAKNSPKIVALFNQTRTEYFKKNNESSSSIPTKTDTVYIERKLSNLETEQRIKSTVIRSMLLPGLGHLYKGSKSKGWVLTALSSFSLASTLYFSIDAAAKEDEFINETNEGMKIIKYDRFISSRDIRNISVYSYIVIWLFTQIDLLVFEDYIIEFDTINTGINPPGSAVLELKYIF